MGGNLVVSTFVPTDQIAVPYNICSHHASVASALVRPGFQMAQKGLSVYHA
jgi:hypothetical protein